MEQSDVLAWVESPLQLLGAAEWAAAQRRRVPVAGRLTAQMPQTADELVARGAWFGELAPYLGIPWGLLARHRHWLVGDGFSGQFRLAASVLRPRRVTFLDDGANTIAFADSLLGARPYARPQVDERGLTARIAPLARATVLDRAHDHRADFFTAFDLGGTRRGLLEDRGFGIRTHAFEWTRSSARVPAELGRRVLLGSARPVDGRMPRTEYLDWARRIAADGEVSYLPHRREAADLVSEVAAIPGVRAVRTDLPVELVLAGTREPLEIFTQPSSTTTTLLRVLQGTGSTVAGRTTGAAGGARPAPAPSRDGGMEAAR